MNEPVQIKKLYSRIKGALDINPAIQNANKTLFGKVDARIQRANEAINAGKKYVTADGRKEVNAAKKMLKKSGFKYDPNSKASYDAQAQGFIADMKKSVVKDKELRKAMEDNPFEAISGTKDAAMYAGSVAKEYLIGGTPKQNALRMGVIGSAYAGAAIGARKLDGGTLTTNSNGEKDIAGIPFI